MEDVADPLSARVLASHGGALPAWGSLGPVGLFSSALRTLRVSLASKDRRSIMSGNPHMVDLAALNNRTIGGGSSRPNSVHFQNVEAGLAGATGGQGASATWKPI